MERKLIIFIDSGDTLVDERTETHETGTEIVATAELRPGALELITTLKDKGYTVILVADGYRQSFINVHNQHGLYDCYDAHIYSEDVGIEKPDARMFDAAFGAAKLSEKDHHRVIMVGNNLARDIKGANDYGLTSVFISWTDRYPKEPSDKSEVPDYTIVEPLELLDLVNDLESKLNMNQF